MTRPRAHTPIHARGRAELASIVKPPALHCTALKHAARVNSPRAQAAGRAARTDARLGLGLRAQQRHAHKQAQDGEQARHRGHYTSYRPRRRTSRA